MSLQLPRVEQINEFLSSSNVEEFFDCSLVTQQRPQKVQSIKNNPGLRPMQTYSLVQISDSSTSLIHYSETQKIIMSRST